MSLFLPPGVLHNSSAGSSNKAVASVEYLTVTFGNADAIKTVNLTKGQIESKCVPFISARINTTQVSFSQLDLSQIGISVEVYNNGGIAALRLRRQTTFRSFVCHIYVVEFADNVSVTRGTITYSGATSTRTISAVNLNKTFLAFTYTGGGQGDPRDLFVLGKFNSATQIEFNRNNTLGGPNGSITAWYYIVQDMDGAIFNVQSVLPVLGAGITQLNSAISPVVMSNTMIVGSGNGASISDAANSQGYSYLQSATNVRSVRTNSNDNPDRHSSFIVEFLDGTTVQRGIKATNTGAAGDFDKSETIPIVPVDVSKSIAQWLMGSHGSRSGRSIINNGAVNHSIEVAPDGASIIMRYRGSGVASTYEAAWEVVTFNI